MQRRNGKVTCEYEFLGLQTSDVTFVVQLKTDVILILCFRTMLSFAQSQLHDTNMTLSGECKIKEGTPSKANAKQDTKKNSNEDDNSKHDICKSD